MPYQSYDDPAQALENAQGLVEAGAQVVKLEGGALRLAVVRHLSEHGIPVCAHLGLTPQSIEELGGYKVQGRDAAGAAAILQDATDLQAAGAVMLVLECVPTVLAQQVTASLAIPTIGIGAGPHCDGQVLVLHDMLGISSGRLPRFVKDFMSDSGGIEAAVAAYVQAVKTGTYPGPEHAYN